jgi:ribose transport system substrate-binding protein
MAMGAYIATKDADRDENMYFIGIDGLPGPEGGAQAVLNGELNATFLYPTGGREAIQTAMKILYTEPVEKQITLETATIDRENAARFLGTN